MAKRKHLHHPISSFVSCTLLVLSALLALQLPGPLQLSSPSPDPVSPGTSVRQSPTGTPKPTHRALTSQTFPSSPAPTANPSPSPEPSPTPAVTIPEPQPQPGNGHINYPYVAFGAVSDPMYSQQWDLSKVSAATAWSKTTGQGVVVAVIDTGVDFNHEDLAGQWWTNPAETGPTTQEGATPNCTSRSLTLDKSCNNLDDDGNGYVDDWRGWDFANNDNDPSVGTTNPTSSAAFHATFVSGLIAALGNNGKGIAGMAYGAKIMPLQALTDDGSGYTDGVAAAVQYAADHGANVINMSLGSSYDDPYLHDMVDYAISKGVTVVAASGNNGCNCVAFPANYQEVVSVGATDSSDNLASFSNYGTNLDLSAPGVNVCSTYWTSGNPTNGYSCFGSGTSFSTPLVSGAVALIVSLNPGISPTQVSAVLTHADKVGAMAGQNFTSQFGYGRLDASYFQVVLAALLGSTP
jgi:subtilisin family serine protease